MTTINVPASLREAKSRLGALGKLLTATEWERAAVLAAFVSLAEGRGKALANAGSSISCEEFSSFGIVGLKSKDTVRRYVQAWADSGKPRPEPGTKVTLPTEGFPPDEKNMGSRATVATVIRKAQEDPDYAANVVEGIRAVAPKALYPKGIDPENFGAAGKAFEKKIAQQYPFLTASTASSYVDRARQLIVHATKELVDIELGENEVILQASIQALDRALTLLKARVDGAPDIDWDAELASLTVEEGEG